MSLHDWLQINTKQFCGKYWFEGITARKNHFLGHPRRKNMRLMKSSLILLSKYPTLMGKKRKLEFPCLVVLNLKVD